jgi:RNA polymerase subunit RPABC4/transcription elongation factor Spt4
MGEILSANCRCGYRVQRLRVGCGMASLLEGGGGGLRIVSCSTCKEILSMQVEDDKCYVCGSPVQAVALSKPSDDLSLPRVNDDMPREEILRMWKEYRKKLSANLFVYKDINCPKCNNESLTFRVVGSWD